MKKDNFQLSTFLSLPAMAGQAYTREAFHTDRQFPGRYLYGGSSYYPEVDHPFYTTSSDRQFQSGRGELLVSALSGDRYPAGRFVCKIYRTG